MRLLLLGTFCFLLGTGGIITSFISKRLEPTYQRIFQILGGILILSGFFVFGFNFCRGKKSNEKKVLRRTKRSKKPQELDRAYYGNENLAGPNYEGGISVISPRNYSQQSDRRSSRHGRVVENPGGGQDGHLYNHHSDRRSSGHGRVVDNPGGGQDSHMNNHHRGSLDSIHSDRSSSLSFDSSLSYGRYPELRSSLRKPGQRDSASLTSNSSSKKSVRLALGGEMTAV